MLGGTHYGPVLCRVGRLTLLAHYGSIAVCWRQRLSYFVEITRKLKDVRSTNLAEWLPVSYLEVKRSRSAGQNVECAIS